ncbi:hypothetical protein F900_01878 [Acinetobacter modestus]|uniref:Uncharacterized protein n=1 Tax=Acinetobacter modestus TaxID=1776740 RepID=N9LXA4_9GAMM|nr:hypothetical protein [Acinetobacter modestus]ENX00894.1 hypothetical protein F900_01878 [Acinetobacter modestus]
MKYVVCTGKTVTHGVLGKGSVVETQTFSAGDLVTITDKKELERLLKSGVIRPLEDVSEEEDEKEGE